MKKLLLSLALLLSISLTANAQSIKRPNPNRHRHYVEYAKPAPHRHVQQMPDYVGELRFHAMGSIAPGSIVQMFRRYNPDSFMVGGMFEYQAGRAVSLGIGGEFYGSYCNGNRRYYTDLDYYTYSIPVYGNLRLMIPSGEVRPFVEGRIGYAIPVSSAHSYAYNTEFQAQGLFTGLGCGLIVGHSDFTFGFNVTDLYNRANPNNAPWGYFTDFFFRYSYAFNL